MARLSAFVIKSNQRIQSMLPPTMILLKQTFGVTRNKNVSSLKVKDPNVISWLTFFFFLLPTTHLHQTLDVADQCSNESLILKSEVSRFQKKISFDLSRAKI